MSTDKTLADVQPGGMVRLGDQAERARFEDWYVQNAFDYESNPIGSRDCALMRKAWNAALSAQPSPAGQGDALAAIAAKLRAAGANLPAPPVTGTIEGSVVTGLSIALALVEEALAARQPVCGACHEAIQSDAMTGTKCACSIRPRAWLLEWKNGVTALTTDSSEAEQNRNYKNCSVVPVYARQPVGEPVSVEAVATVRRWSNGDRYIDWLTEGGIADLEVGDVLMVSDRAVTDEDGSGELYAAPPAQAVDLERFRGTVKSQYTMTEWMHRCGFVSAEKLEDSKKNHDHLLALIDSQAVGR